MPRDICFYGQKAHFREFSNFYPAPIELDGKVWPTTEHYFQACKFVHTSPDYAELIRQAATPGDAKRMGASRAHPIQGDWDAERDRVMERAVEAKFTQHPHLRQMLLDTGDARLREHTRRDRYWGDGGDANTGLNKLGKILMRLRTQLQQQDGVIDSSANAAAAAAAAAPAAPAASAASAASAAAANYSVQTGNLLEAKEQYLVQQCNSVSKSAKGLSAALFKKFKFADVYASRAQGKRGKDQPGTISVHRSPLGIGPSVVNLFGQVAPGTPKGGGSDNAAARLAYFQQGLAELAKLNPESVAFPFQIGCGLGGGSWPDYERALRDFAAQVAPARVVVYRLPDTAAPSPPSQARKMRRLDPGNP